MPARLSSVPAFTSTTPGIVDTRVRMGDPQLPQKWRYEGCPLSPRSSNTLVSPCCVKLASFTKRLNENRLALCFWQCRQWQMAAVSGSPFIT
ncbi:hypothetical protein D3C86_1478230 [compost metagenome]